LFGQLFGEMAVVVILVALLGQSQDLLPYAPQCGWQGSASIAVCHGRNPSLAVCRNQPAKLPLRDA